MTSLFSKVSDQFTKAFVIGALFPATIFVVTIYLFVLPMMPWDVQALARFSTLDAQWRLALLGVAAMILAFLLNVLNIPILRFYEGYPWVDGTLGRYWTKRARKVVEDAIAQRAAINAQREAMRKAGQVDGQAMESLIERERELILLTWAAYPDAPAVLPTRFGNTIRAFEMYPQRQYGIDAITLWPRFVAKIDPAYAPSIDDAKSAVDFAVHLSLLSKITFLLVLFAGLAFQAPFASTPLLVVWLLTLGGSAFLAWLLYRVAIDRVAEWGDLVRGAFDLHRRPVLQALGFEEVPSDLESERKLWFEISRQLAYGDPLKQPVRVRFSAPAIEVRPRDESLVVTRGVTVASTTTRHFIRIANKGAKPVKGIRITERVSAARQLVWGSVKVGADAATFSGTNPYVIEVGTLAPSAVTTVTYDSVAA